MRCGDGYVTNFLYPDLITMTVSIPMDFMCLKSASHSFSPQFWWGMSCEISSRNVPVIFRPSALGTIRLPVDAEAPAVFLRPIPVAAGAMIPGTVTAAAAAAVFLMKVLLSI